ncbi:type 1 glutamine amidotransferase [Ectopseudomonas mendocina]|uniref:Type 1 glutamine amidotransferase n=2 Tax=Ectopseudomonas mendocina TaxID=300 RepID=A0ABD7RQ73_ECTME|nr:type 1 glutamine amidotransferase [Pseudomonas mendocina]ALN18964.1 glutamine amidotransferase [Pseudomonas mendocina S5.2]KES00173.1 glutamine amidotransferase [Pseudomonas mendocina]TRO11882.1 type 1 glutamine amidotransferase [Pseudomonas mendocina]TRO13857.1 type 1 glutamine amidotransferase [Pseudomonas mendocina]
MADVLILTHIDYCPPAHLAQVLELRGCSFDVLRVDEGQLHGYDLERPKAVAVMGGPMSVNDPLPWIAEEVAALQRFIERDIPIIGHCLGGQLLARALGASVRRMPYTEAGWQILERRAESAGSPWLAHLPESFSIFQWHGDTFTMPEGAQPLLSSRWCDNQAFAWGDKVLVLQGHPEMTEDLIALWLDDWAHLLDAGQPSQQSIDEMREGLSKKVRALNHVAEGFYAHWLKLAGL